MPEFKLLLEDNEVEALKIMAAKQRVRPQAIARDAFRRGMSSPKLVTPTAVPLGDIPERGESLRSLSPSQLSDVRQALNQALAIINGVITDGEGHPDKLSSIKGELERTLANSGNSGVNRPDSAEVRVTKPKGRRAR